jgi:hypothetical protein
MTLPSSFSFSAESIFAPGKRPLIASEICFGRSAGLSFFGSSFSSARADEQPRNIAKLTNAKTEMQARNLRMGNLPRNTSHGDFAECRTARCSLRAGEITEMQ